MIKKKTRAVAPVAEINARTAYHRKIEREERAPAEHLVQYLARRYSPKTVCDFGCSTGTYVHPWATNVYAVVGFESDPVAVANRIDDRVRFADLTSTLLGGYGHDRTCEVDLGLCLEVLEHIPEQNAHDVLRNVTDLIAAKGVLVFSAAIPGQGGEGHVNCQDKPYWIRLFEDLGWVVDYVETVALLDAIVRGPHMGWMRQNAMVLRRFGGTR